jgi:hypothetical protein
VVMFVDSYMLRSSRGLVLGVVFCSHTRVLAQLDCFVWSSVASCCVVLLCLADRPFIFELTFTLLILVSGFLGLWQEHSLSIGVSRVSDLFVSCSSVMSRLVGF